MGRRARGAEDGSLGVGGVQPDVRGWRGAQRHLGRAGDRDGRIARPGDFHARAGRVLRELFEGGVPVLHGDVAMDLARGAAIVSGDQLVTYMATALEAEVVAVGSNVDGVLVSGRPLQSISRKDLPEFENAIGGSAGVDVTGGMRGKLLELLDLADLGIESVIFNAGIEGNIARALKGETLGTRIRRSK